MSFKVFLLLACVAAVLGCGDAKVYGQCELIQTLRSLGVPEQQIGTWVCIAQHESNYDTTAINHNTGDYGIFQISELYWCSNSNTPGKGCGITCNSLLGDDISTDVSCARIVYDQTAAQGKNGFSAWTTYQFCSGDNSGWVVC